MDAWARSLVLLAVTLFLISLRIESKLFLWSLAFVRMATMSMGHDETVARSRDWVEKGELQEEVRGNNCRGGACLGSRTT